jgi:hypothetical protein
MGKLNLLDMDWRWGLTADSTPWYTTMRLFRQTEPGNWARVMKQVAQALSEKFLKIVRKSS